MTEWINVCRTDEIAAEEGFRYDHGKRSFAIFRNHQDEYFCTDGHCTHENVHLADGLVIENTVECPKHASIFDFTTSEVDAPPACENVRTYPIRVEAGRILIEL